MASITQGHSLADRCDKLNSPTPLTCNPIDVPIPSTALAVDSVEYDARAVKLVPRYDPKTT